jgi:phosphoglycolate phosphatase
MKIVIFDMDGTLLDSKTDITTSINYIRKLQYSLPPLKEDFVVEAINMDERNLPKLFYGTDIYKKSDKKLFEIHYASECIKNTYLYDGIFDMLQTLKRADVKLNVATNAPTPFALRMLKHLNVLDMFDMVVGADKVKESKPNPQMLEMILKFYDFDPKKDQAWMVGDSTKDIKSAKNAKIDSIFATWGFSPKGEANSIIDNPKEVLDIVL